jgi:hypothetical protein
MRAAIAKTCLNCGSNFVPIGNCTNRPRKYCSQSCSTSYRNRHSPRPPTPIEQRFWKKVNKLGGVPVHAEHLGHCWVWVAATQGGYGALGTGPRPARIVRAHVFSWELHRGSTEGLWVLHKCDNKACVNPDHLFLGTCQDNHDDMIAKGREKVGRLCGCSNKSAKLSAADVAFLRAQPHKYGQNKIFGRLFGVHPDTIGRARNERSYSVQKEASNV